MNLILLSESECAAGGLPATDARAKHVREVLKLEAGGKFFVGVAGGLRGLATLLSCDATGIAWRIDWEKEMQPALPVHILVGLPRPQTARKILHDLASLGAKSIRFFITEKGDPAYAQSSLWRAGEAGELLRKGAEQAFSTLLPALAVCESLEDALAGVAPEAGAPATAKVFLDIYETAGALPEAVAGKKSAILAIGSERGWSAGERALLLKNGYAGAHMGDRVLRVETACVAAGAVALGALGVWRKHG